MPSLDVAIDARKAKQGAREFDSAVKKVQRGAGGVDQSIKRVDGSINHFGGGMKKVAAGLITMAVAYKALRFAMSSVKEAVAFELGLANISTMLDKQTMLYLPKYEKALKKLSIQYGQSTGTLSKGLYDILSASVNAAKATIVLEVSAKAAIAGLTDTATAADALTTILNSYGLAAEEASRVGDILFATVKRGKITFGELAGSVGKVAALAATAGLTMEELSAAISTMTRSGIQSDLAMTSLKGILTTILSPTRESVIVARKYGLELNTASLRAEGLVAMMEKLEVATDEDIAAIFSNVRALTGVAALRQDLTGFIKDQEEALRSLGMQEIAYGKIADTNYQRLEKGRQLWKSWKVGFGEYLIGVVADLPTVAEAYKDHYSKILGYKEASIKELLSPMVLKYSVSTDWEAPDAATLRKRSVYLVAQEKQEKARMDVIRKYSEDEAAERTAWSKTILDWQAKMKAAEKEQQEVMKYTSELKEKYFRELEIEKSLIGLTTEERERAIRIAKFEMEAKKVLGEDAVELVEEYKKELLELQKAYDLAEFSAKIEESLEGLIRSPLTALLNETRDIGQVLEEELKQLGTSILESMYEEMITTPLKESLTKALRPVFSQATAMLSQLLGGVAGGITSSIGGFFGMAIGSAFLGGFGGGGTTTLPSTGGMGSGTAFAEKGMVLKRFAKGDILTQPTIFPMSNGGLGLAGEAGNEAIMPLARDGRGRLGVRANEGAAGGTPIKIINVMDASEVQEYLNSADGERQIVNIMQRNNTELSEIID